jgi:hypothetical protein
MDTYSETHRHQCEVRDIIRKRLQHGSDWARAHLAGIAKKRGTQAAERLMSDIKAQWAAGNRGEQGDWR